MIILHTYRDGGGWDSILGRNSVPNSHLMSLNRSQLWVVTGPGLVTGNTGSAEQTPDLLQVEPGPGQARWCSLQSPACPHPCHCPDSGLQLRRADTQALCCNGQHLKQKLSEYEKGKIYIRCFVWFIPN